MPADVVFIGEAPGASEDALGLPFVGPAGHLHDQIIERALPSTMRYVLTNLVCCFPREAKSRGENEPEHKEIMACQPRLVEFVNIAQPRLIVCVGALAAQYIDHRDTVTCCDIVHPAAILRMPLAQKQMAAQKAIVVLRCAVDSVLQSEYREFTKWGNRYASLTPRERLRADYDAYKADIPF
jgi:uracil-DNA glycosylase